jgi:hypothetical protein
MTELKIVTDAAAILRESGETAVEYITAEFSPFSNQFRPDLVYRPNTMPGHVFFIEYLLASYHMLKQPAEAISEQLVEHRDFITTDPSVALHFAFASSGDHDPLLAETLALKGITFTDDLAQATRDWVKSLSTRSTV